jgi:hypothetical protein
MFPLSLDMDVCKSRRQSSRDEKYSSLDTVLGLAYELKILRRKALYSLRLLRRDEYLPLSLSHREGGVKAITRQ